jgi:hypothetical protein
MPADGLEAALTAAPGACGSDLDEQKTVARAWEKTRQVRESPAEVMARIWREPLPWRDRSVEPADGHAMTNVVPGRPLS